jgi:GT2 family glycosyltransferase
MGQEPHWQALDNSPEFRLDLSIPPHGGWLSLAWHSSLTDTVSRPILIFDGRNEHGAASETDVLLAGASFGAQQATVFVPAGTTAIRFSPGDAPVRFGLRMVEARWISQLEAFRRGLSLQPFAALHAFGALLIRRTADFRLLLAEAIGARPMKDYARWKAERSRTPEWDGLDALSVDNPPRLRLLAIGWEGDPAAMASIPAAWRPDWRMVEPCSEWGSALAGLNDRDLVLVAPKGALVRAEAIPAMLRAAAENPDAVLFFGDEEIDQPGGLVCRFQPGFDPLLSFQLLGSAAVFGLRVGTLRAWGRGEAPPESPAGLALHRPLARRGAVTPAAAAVPGLLAWLAGGWPIHRQLPAASAPDVAILIPTRDRLELLRACIESIEPTLSSRAEIIIIDNESREADTLAYFRDFENNPDRKMLPVPGPFNFSKLCNAGARETNARVLIFLNNDTTVLAADWIARLCHFAIRPECGAVGARLLYPSGRVQHAGVVVGVGGYAGHIDLHLAGNADGQFERARRDHSLLAVTGACLAVERTKFEAVGGFDEENLPVDLNDIDLCLRLVEKGWRTIYAAGAELMHHESASRGRKPGSSRYRKHKAYFAARWRTARRADPHFHPSLSLLLTRPSLG